METSPPSSFFLHSASLSFCVPFPSASSSSPPAHVFPSTMDDANPMEFKVPCSFESCPLLFETQAEMLAHKHRDPDHSHCLKCREEFATRQEFFLHKIGSPRHFTCPICMADFRSDSGRQRHFKEVSISFDVPTFILCYTSSVPSNKLTHDTVPQS